MPSKPSKPRALGTEDHLRAALTAWRIGGFYRSPEACAKAHKVHPSTFRRRLQGKHKSHQIAYINQYRITLAGEAAIVRHYIYLANARISLSTIYNPDDSQYHPTLRILPPPSVLGANSPANRALKLQK